MTTFDSTHPLFHLIPPVLVKNGVVILSETEGVDPRTVRGGLMWVLLANGLFRDVATQVLDEMFESNPALKPIQGRAIAGYPPVMMNTLWFTARASVLKWMDAEAPQHFARCMFAFEDEPATPIESERPKPE